MEILDLTKEQTKKTLKAGTVLLLQGRGDKAISILHSGLAEILYNEEILTESDSGEIVGNSLRVGFIKGESPFGIMGIMNRKETSGLSIRCVTECIISSKPVNAEELISRIQSDLYFNFKILRTLITRIESTFYLFNNYRYLWHKFASIADSLALGVEYKADMGNMKYNRSSSTLEEYSGYVKTLISNGGFPRPEPWSYNLFLGKLQDQLGLYADLDESRIEDILDYQQFLFIKRIIRKNDNVLKVLFEKDEPLNQYIFEFLGDVLERMMKTNMGLATVIRQLISILYDSGGWVDKILRDNDQEKQNIRDFLHFLAKFSWRCRQDTIKLLGIDLVEGYPLYKSLKKYKDLTIAVQSQNNTQTDMSSKTDSRLLKYRGLLKKILEFSDLSQSFKDEFLYLIEKFRNEKNKFGNDQQLEKLRQDISLKYWQLYEVCFLKIIDSDLMGFVPGVMLHFGLVDESLVSKEELLLIDDFYSRNLCSDDSIPVMTLPYYLEKIYRSEANPSITDMGDSFIGVLKKQEKMTEGQKKGRYLYEDTAEDRVRYEIRIISRELCGVLFGNKAKSVPILCSEMFSGNMKRFFVDPDLLVIKIEKIQTRDFSLFYREVMQKHELGSDFIQKEVFPNFVLYPGIGSRALLWQELDGARKDSEGRFFIPLFFSEKLTETLLYQLASFRWELQKTIAGHKWTDAVEGGIVGAYYDYIQFYKKNPAISSEAKKRLEEFTRKTKSDKDRFARDYITWVEYEYEGKVRLNGAAREIFYRFCPFPKETREKMINRPLYGQLEIKFQNRRQKEILRLKSRFLKFEKKNKTIIPELYDYMRYLEK